MKKLAITAGVLAGLVALYAALGYLLVPRLIERQLVAQVEQRLGCPAQFEAVRFDPFRFIAEMDGVTLCRDGGPLDARKVRLDFDPFSSGFGRGWVFGELGLDGVALSLERSAKGRWNIADMLERLQGEKAPQQDASNKDGSSTSFTVRRVALRGASIAIVDRTQQPVASAKLEPIDIQATNLGMSGESQVTLQGAVQDGGTLDATAAITASPLNVSGEAKLSGIALALPHSFFASATNLQPPGGKADIALQFRYSQDAGFAASALQVAGSDVRLQLSGDDEPLGAAKTLRLANGQYDPGKRVLQFDEMALAQGALTFRKEAGGVNWGRMMKSRHEPAEKKSGSPFDVRFAKVSVDAIDLTWGDADRPRPYDMRFVALTGEGVLQLSLGGEKTQVLLTQTSLAADPAVLATGGGEPVRLQQVTLEQGKLDVAGSELSLGRFSINGGWILAVREEDGVFTLARAFASDKASGGGPPWRFAVDDLRAESVAIEYEDRTYNPKLSYPVTANINLRGYGGDEPMAFELAARAGEGTLKAGGTLAQHFDRVDANVRAEAITLKPLQPIVGQFARVTIAAGTATAQMKVAWQGGTRGSLGLDGGAAIDGLRLNDEADRESVISWKRLTADSVRYRSNPAGTEIERIVIDAPRTRLEIDKGRQLNLTRLIRERPATRSEERKAEVEAGAKRSPAKGTFPVHVGSVQFRNGLLEYADQTLIFPFDTEVSALGGFVTGLSNDPSRHAQVNLGGRIEPFGEARAEGSLAAFAPRSFLDMRVNFANMPLPKLSPYSATFLGRTMAEGRIWLDLGYEIKDGQLTGNNRISIRDLKLGEKVNAPGARDLPLDLAVALLTDENGVLTTDLRVSGDVDNPKFDVSSLVRAAIGNLVSRVVTAPFRALGRLFGLGDGDEGEEQVGIDFEPGSARISPPQEEKLVKLAGALAQRPQLTLTVTAPYDVERDLAALREQSARVQLARALGRDEQPEAVDIESDCALAAMRSLLGVSASATGAGSEAAEGRGAVDRGANSRSAESKAADRKSAETKAANSEASTGEVLLGKLAQEQPVEAAAARVLAANRAEAITKFLNEKGVASGRLQRGELVEHTDHKKAISAPLELGAATQVSGSKP